MSAGGAHTEDVCASAGCVRLTVSCSEAPRYGEGFSVALQRIASVTLDLLRPCSLMSRLVLPEENNDHPNTRRHQHGL